MTLPDVPTLIPHRDRWKIVDRLVSVEGETAVAEADFSEEYCRGHFPQQAVVPGVALLEGLAQTMLCMSKILEPDVDGTPFLVGFDRVRFRAPVLPPATVEFTVRVTERRGVLTTSKGTAKVNGKRVATCTLIGTIAQLPK